MADFTEIWNLRNKLILDGLYSTNEPEPIDALALERNIMRLAAHHYGWTAPEPHSGPYTYDWREKDSLSYMTPQMRIEDALDILIDWDGYRSYRGLGSLIDEVRARLAYQDFMEEEILEEEAEYWKINFIEDFVENNKDFIQDIEDIKDDELSYFIDIFAHRDYKYLCEWCMNRGINLEIVTIYNDYNLIALRFSKDELI